MKLSFETFFAIVNINEMHGEIIADSVTEKGKVVPVLN
jgi:hypothetical protein